MSVKHIDYTVEKESVIQTLLDALTLNAKDLTFAMNRLIANKKLDRWVSRHLANFKTTDGELSGFYITAINSDNKYQQKTIDNKIKNESIEFKDEFYSFILASTLNSLDEIVIEDILDKIYDVSYRDNLCMKLALNANNSISHKLIKRPEVMFKSIELNDERVMRLFDPEEFTKDYPEFFL